MVLRGSQRKLSVASHFLPPERLFRNPKPGSLPSHLIFCRERNPRQRRRRREIDLLKPKAGKRRRERGCMNPAGMAGAGRRLCQHRPLASNLTDGSVPNLLLPSGLAVEGFSLVPVSKRVFGPLPRQAPNPGMPADMSTAGRLPVLDSPLLGTTSVAPVLQTSLVPVSKRVFGPLPRQAPNPGMPADMSTAGRLPVLDSPLLGTTSVAPVLQTVVSSLPSRYINTTSFSLMKNTGGNPLALQHMFGTVAGPTAGLSTVTKSGASTLVLQIKKKFCTKAGDPLVTNLGDDNAIGFHRGNAQELCQRITAQIDDMKAKVINFKAKYKKSIRPSLVSRCLIVPFGIDDPSTVFLHRQTFEIANRNPSYLSCFDVMGFETGCKDCDEWDRFLDHLVDRKVYVIEDWSSSFSTIETLMYDHGLKQPDDGTDVPFYKGECDAAYDPKTKIASLSYIIWKDDKIIHSEVFSCLEFSSPVNAEIYAAFALLSKAEELGIHKLLVCSDSRTVTTILNGEHPIGMNHKNRDFYLMLRAMRSRFKWLVVTWKPRELMVFADGLAKAAKSLDSDAPFIPRFTIMKWSSLLRGLPVFRIERINDTNKAVKRFGDVVLDESYGTSGNSVYFVEVEEDFKFDCLAALRQTLEPSELKVCLSNYGGKPDSFKQQLDTIFCKTSVYGFKQLPGGCCILTGTFANNILQSKCLVVALDYSLPKEVYYNRGAFHIVLVTPTELETMTEKIPELTALGFVYFNEVRFPLNKNDAGAQNGKKKNEEKKLAPRA